MNISVTQEQPRGGFHHCSLAGARLELAFVRLMRPGWIHLQSPRCRAPITGWSQLPNRSLKCLVGSHYNLIQQVIPLSQGLCQSLVSRLSRGATYDRLASLKLFTLSQWASLNYEPGPSRWTSGDTSRLFYREVFVPSVLDGRSNALDICGS